MEKTAVIVVHGVGDPLPGDALTGLTKGLSDPACGLLIERIYGQRVEHRHAPAEASAPGTQPEVPTFPVTKAELVVSSQLDSSRHLLHLREVYWGDLSRVKSSIPGLLQATLDFIFGLRHVVNAARIQTQGKLGKVAGAAALSALWTARGPMFALEILAAVVCCLYALLPVRGLPLLGIARPLAATLLGSVAVALAGRFLRSRSAHLQWSPSTANWMLGLSALAFVAACWYGDRSSDSLWPYVNAVTKVMTVGALLIALFAIASLVFGCLAWWLSDSNQATGGTRPTGPLTALGFCTALSIGLFVLVVVVAWLLIQKAITPSLEDRSRDCLKAAVPLDACLRIPDPLVALAERIECGVHLFPMLVAAFGVVALIYAGILGVNTYRSKRGSKPPLRWIVNAAVVWGYLLASLAYALTFAVLAYVLFRSDTCSVVVAPLASPWAASFMAFVDSFEKAYKPASIAFGSFLILLITWSRSQFLTALDLVLDVVAHFKRDVGDESKFVPWVPMVERFRLVVQDALAETKADRLVVIAHSQGTTVALHGLGVLTITGCDVETVQGDGANRVLVTMGCPVDHLYRHYMPDRYAYAPDARSRVYAWHNIHRSDDFIGREIAGLTGGPPAMPVNHNVGAGGHTDYWRDPRVLEHIVPCVLVRAS